jgi:pimeloyl-ACP methyl ester carboxylesterase
MGIYRATFASIAQTDPLMVRQVRTPIVTMGRIKGLGAIVARGVSLVAENVEAHTFADSGHFLPEERPDEIVEQIVSIARKSLAAHLQNQINLNMPGAQ